jgi:phospholipid N-methyltransferase
MAENRKKQTGSFYTESKIAQWLVKWAIRNSGDSVLEPSFGDGVFIEQAFARFRALENHSPHITAVEIQNDVFERIKQKFTGKNLDAYAADFLSLDVSQQFDVVIGNPPYIGIKKLPQHQKLYARQIIDKYEIHCPNNGSLWFPFVLHATDALKINGRLGFVMPFEITYVRYANGLWKMLSKQYSNISLCRIYEDFFPNVDVETVLLLAEGKGGCTTYINYQIYNKIDDLLSGNITHTVRIPVSEIGAASKPFVYSLLTKKQQELISRFRHEKIIVPVADICKFKIGYVCADKKYFHPNSDTRNHYCLPPGNFLPAILNAKELNDGTGIGAEADRRQCENKLYLPQNITKGDKIYIQSGEMLGVHQKYKCRIRNPWYITPNVEIPDVILSVFGEIPKLVVNKGKYAVSNSLLCGTLLNEAVPKLQFLEQQPIKTAVLQPVGRKTARACSKITDLGTGSNITSEEFVCRWYNSLTLLSLEINVHSLGGGSFVIIPGEADSLDIINTIPKKQITQIYKKFDESLKTHGVEETYKLGDIIVLKEIMNITDETLSIIYKALAALKSWRNPSNRRCS